MERSSTRTEQVVMLLAVIGAQAAFQMVQRYICWFYVLTLAAFKLMKTKKLSGTLTVFSYPGEDDLSPLQTALKHTFSVVGLLLFF